MKRVGGGKGGKEKRASRNEEGGRDREVGRHHPKKQQKKGHETCQLDENQQPRPPKQETSKPTHPKKHWGVGGMGARQGHKHHAEARDERKMHDKDKLSKGEDVGVHGWLVSHPHYLVFGACLCGPLVGEKK